MIPKNEPEGEEARKEYYSSFFADLERDLLIYSRLKNKFRKKFTAIPFSVLKANNFEEMNRIKEYHSEEEFLERAYKLGFQRGRKTYSGIRGKRISVFQQAGDYINLLFCFDDTIHNTISMQLDKKHKLGQFYKYINSLGE